MAMAEELRAFVARQVAANTREAVAALRDEGLLGALLWWARALHDRNRAAVGLPPLDDAAFVWEIVRAFAGERIRERS